MVTTSHGGNPKSNDARAMQVAGDKNAIVWQIFLTLVVSIPFAIKLSANCAAMLVTKIEANGGRIET